MNPYGAVPAALEQTRLTLRDIMAGYVNQKIQESKLNLAHKQMEVEARALELEGEKQKAQTEFNLARIAADTARQDTSYALEREKFGHSQEMDRLRLPLVQKQIETAGVQAQTEKERLGQEKLKTQ
jgi:aconitase B